LTVLRFGTDTGRVAQSEEQEFASAGDSASQRVTSVSSLRLLALA
jgi:hypothetical protein